MSLRDELAQVLRRHYGSLWCPTCHPAGRRDWDTPWDVVAHQADAVIAHLALTEETAVKWPGSKSAHNRRRYVTPWEEVRGDG